MLKSLKNHFQKMPFFQPYSYFSEFVAPSSIVPKLIVSSYSINPITLTLKKRMGIVVAAAETLNSRGLRSASITSRGPRSASVSSKPKRSVLGSALSTNSVIRMEKTDRLVLVVRSEHSKEKYVRDIEEAFQFR